MTKTLTVFAAATLISAGACEASMFDRILADTPRAEDCLLLGADADESCRRIEADVALQICEETHAEWMSDPDFDVFANWPQKCMRYGYDFGQFDDPSLIITE